MSSYFVILNVLQNIKSMKKLLLTVLVAASVCACTKDLENRVDTLEKKVAELEAKANKNAEEISKLGDAAAKAVTITSVETLSDGYTIHFSDGTSATIKNGQDGTTPTVGVKEEDGVLYWTVNGEFLLDNGQKVPAKGETPQFKIEDEKWKVSFDGENWEEVPVSGTVAPVLVMEETETEYVFTLGQTVIRIAKDKAFSLKVSADEQSVIPGKTLVLNYTLVGADETTHILAESKEFDVTVDEAAKSVKAQIPSDFVEGYILIKAVRNSDGRYSAQYVSLARDVYGTHGGTIVINDEGYVNW